MQRGLESGLSIGQTASLYVLCPWNG